MAFLFLMAPRATRACCVPRLCLVSSCLDGPVADRPQSDLQDDDTDSEGDDENQSGDGEADAPRFSFPELTQQIRSAITSYGAVFPKLNWTSPRVSFVSPLVYPAALVTVL